MFSSKVTELIDKLEKICQAFFGVKFLIRDVRIEKYRQDNPSVYVCYKKGDELDRNIILLVQDDGTYVSFDANIWIDDKSTLTRRWLNKSSGGEHIGVLSDVELSVLVAIILEKIFNSINDTEEGQLVNISKLQPVPG